MNSTHSRDGMQIISFHIRRGSFAVSIWPLEDVGFYIFLFNLNFRLSMIQFLRGYHIKVFEVSDLTFFYCLNIYC